MLRGGGEVAGGRRRERPPDGAHCSRCAGLQQCRSFVEMCMVSYLIASPVCICGRRAAIWGCPCGRSPCRHDSPAPLYWLLFVWLQCHQRTSSPQSRGGGGVVSCLHLPGACSGLPCRPGLRPPRPAGGGGVGFPLRGGVWVE
jgi:hypothetical protein